MDLKKEFHKDMIAIYQNAKKECGYNATRFLQMVAAKDGLTGAKKLHSEKSTNSWICTAFLPTNIDQVSYV
ncbi:hypothetical protein V7124_05060 [Neobacillus niacini]|uniref:hypothetical protein n=1 Tax=Neobacillus niacini TaxID=86668 RepID=UPI002FFEF5D5